MEVLTLHGVCHQVFDQRVDAVTPAGLSHPTPCTDWDVRDLLVHNVHESIWVAPILSGRTLEEIGDPASGVDIHADPVAAWRVHGAAADAAVQQADPEKMVHLSFGQVPAAEYITQRAGDLLIHAWDLARGLGVDDALPVEPSSQLLAWAEPQRQILRSMPDLFGPEIKVPADAPIPVRLLALFGRDAT